MRQRILQASSAVLITFAASTAVAAPMPGQVATAPAEVTILPQPEAAAAAKTGVQRNELRECAALVLVGSMLIGLAAAVRRTA
jgi:hypothetical protein